MNARVDECPSQCVGECACWSVCEKKNPTHTASRIVKRFEQVNLPGKAL